MSDKPRLTRKLLSKHGIIYEQDLEKVSDLPDHVDYLKSALLHFDGTISHRLGLRDDIVDVRHFELNTAFDRYDIKEAERLDVRSIVEKCHNMQQDAKTLKKDGAVEQKWQQLFQKHLFGPWESSTKPSETDTRRVAREKYYYQSFNYTSDNPWSLFAGLRPNSQDKARLSMPNTDYVAYFKVFDMDEPQPKINPSEPVSIDSYIRWPWENSTKRGILRNFSSKVLEHLACYGLEPCAANWYRRPPAEGSERKDYMCFPWLVVEHKRASPKSIQECYCQAANAAHAVLTMLRILARYSDKGLPDCAHIPPVTTITTIGARVEVWVAYATDLSGSCKMSRIWAGDINMPCDVIKLQAIVENLHTYAMHELRPLISSYIDQWLDRFPMDGGPHPDIKNRKPFEDIEGVQIDSPQPEKASIPHTPQGSQPRVAEFESVTKSDILTMLRVEHRQLLDQVADLIKSSQSTPTKDGIFKSDVSSPSPAPRTQGESSPKLEATSSGFNRPVGLWSTQYSDTSPSSTTATKEENPFLFSYPPRRLDDKPALARLAQRSQRRNIPSTSSDRHPYKSKQSSATVGRAPAPAAVDKDDKNDVADHNDVESRGLRTSDSTRRLPKATLGIPVDRPFQIGQSLFAKRSGDDLLESMRNLWPSETHESSQQAKSSDKLFASMGFGGTSQLLFGQGDMNNRGKPTVDN